MTAAFAGAFRTGFFAGALTAFFDAGLRAGAAFCAAFLAGAFFAGAFVEAFRTGAFFAGLAARREALRGLDFFATGLLFFVAMGHLSCNWTVRRRKRPGKPGFSRQGWGV